MIFKNIFRKSNKQGKYNRGVSLIELLVVIAIFMIISSMTIFSYNDFRSSISIQNLADDVALSVRKAQNYAIGAVGSSGYFVYGYGLNFSAKPVDPRTGRQDSKSPENPFTGNESTISSNAKSFILFVDRNNSGFYNEENIVVCDEPNDPRCSENVELLSITSNDVLSGLSITIDDRETKLRENDQIDLLFKRPNPEPSFCYRREGASSCDGSSRRISNIKIKISSERDATIYKIITISNNGQISVDF